MLGKVKKWFGIEGLKIAVNTEESYKREDKVVDGIILLQAKSDELVQNIRIKLIEKYARGRGQSRLIDEYMMADESLTKEYIVQGETTLEIPFSIKYNEMISQMDRLERRNFFYGGFIKAAKFFKKAKSTYRLEIEASVKGTKFSPFVSQDIILE